jgi:hypothetical protein
MSNDEDETVQEGLLSRLDAKLDALELAGRLSVPQLQEQFVGGGFEDGSSVAIRPGCGARQPLREAVRDLTSQWSEGFLAMAREGDAACAYIVAQMSFRPGGYGSIPFNRAAGLAWLFRAVDGGDLEARAWARKVAHEDLLRHMAKKDLAAAAQDDELQLEQAVQRWRIKDKELEEEERRIAAEREKEFGE